VIVYALGVVKEGWVLLDDIDGDNNMGTSLIRHTRRQLQS
jgi:hypothetical protein